MVKREYVKHYSAYLQRDMEFLVFGDGGKPVVFYPTRTARFYDYEDWKVIEALEDKINARELQVYCIDSVDGDSLYNKQITPAERIARHLLFEKYILFDLLGEIKKRNDNCFILSAGCSLGAYHAINMAFRHPHLFKKAVGMSGRYDLTIKLPFFEDLFEGYWNEDIYFNMPSQYVPNIEGDRMLRLLKKLEIIIAIGKEDAFLANNMFLHQALDAKQINHTFHTWEGEAHKAQYWRDMVRLYF